MMKVIALLALGFSLCAHADVKPVPSVAAAANENAQVDADDAAEDIEPMDEMDMDAADVDEWQAEIQEAQWGGSRVWTCRVQSRQGRRFVARSSNSQNHARRIAMSNCARVSSSCRVTSCTCNRSRCW